MKRLNVVLAGLGFGAAFAPIYASHPDVGAFGIYDPDRDLAKAVAARLQGTKTYGNFTGVLNDPSVDAVHLVSPIPRHAEQTLAVLGAGKHCACTVPMAMNLEDLKAVCAAVKKTGKSYCVMETAVYTTHFFKVKEMLHRDEFGRIQFLRGAHYQDMEFWPDYWRGLPPMWYGTHAIAPLVMLAGSPVVRVRGLGSGTMREELRGQYGNPFPVETAQLEFASGLKGEVTRSLFETAHDYTEQFTLYGSKKTFEWQQIETELPVLHTLEAPRHDEGGRPMRGLPVKTERVRTGNCHMLLPEAVRRFTVKTEDYDETNPQLSLERDASGGHGGSHPHMVHEFVRSVLENRAPWINEKNGANIAAAGIAAHDSAMKGGAVIDVPDFAF
ncbi:MAG: Gfo/Idh/MocA family oxidoreductase [Treponema sp.]|jgi:predicted dehydrogenase|nr:Gfo/Idh/MocA family oxidoreductase [Treponema sp.]